MKNRFNNVVVWGEKSPCLNCKKRHVLCHNEKTCEDYRNYRQKIREAKAKYEKRKTIF